MELNSPLINNGIDDLFKEENYEYDFEIPDGTEEEMRRKNPFYKA